MINLLQSVTTQVYYKVQQVVITKCIKYYNVWQIVITKYVWQTLLQTTSGITKCDSYCKVRRNRVCSERTVGLKYGEKLSKLW